MKYKTPKGTRDFMGEEFYRRQWIIKTMLSVVESYGFRQVQTPTFENLEILTKQAGAEIKDQIYTFLDKGNREYGIKSDITPALTRIIANTSQSIPKPIKLTSFDRVYRYERPQKGRYREIYQINAELFGATPPLSDAEVITCLISCYQALDLKNITINIGNRSFLESFIKNIGATSSQVMPAIRLVDKQKKLSKNEFKKELQKIGLSPTQIKKLNQLSKYVGPLLSTLELALKTTLFDDKLKKYLKELQKIALKLKYFGVTNQCQLNLGLARGDEYYTGIIFEALPNKSVGSIGAGGRYDKLSKTFGGPDLAAVGFSIGIDRVDLLIQEQQKKVKKQFFPTINYYIATEKDSLCVQTTVNLAEKLRKKGGSVEIDLKKGNLSEQLQSAKQLKAKFAILIKKDEIKKGQIILINLVTTSEKIVSLEEVAK